MTDVVESDLTARSRIELAAFAVMAERGPRAATLREIAHRAGVSAALVVHHFGGKDGLRAACDERVVRFLREKATTGADAALAQATQLYGPYLARVLTEGDASGALFDALLGIARTVTDDGVARGTMRASADPDALAVVMLLYSLAPFLMADHLERWAGSAALGRLALPMAEIWARGLYTDPGIIELAANSEVRA